MSSYAEPDSVNIALSTNGVFFAWILTLFDTDTRCMYYIVPCF